MKIPARIRAIVKKKFDGRCAFCGHSLEDGCHIWDVKPIQSAVNSSGELVALNTEVQNLLPACKSCASVRVKHSHSRGKMDIEEFRKDIYEMFRFLKGGSITSTSYGRAIRFGLIVETNNPIVFHFEKNKLVF